MMVVVPFGATGMIGQGVLRECLLDPQITRIVTVGRRKTGVVHDKLQELESSSFEELKQRKH